MQINNYEEVAQCDLCGSAERKVVDEKGHIVQCAGCGLKFVSPRLSQGDISEVYDWSYGNCAGWGEVKPEAQLMYMRRFDFLERFVQGGKLLDVGAGLGIFLGNAKKKGRWEAFGTETSRYAVEFAKKEFNIELSQGQLEDLKYPEKSFDAVSFWHVLEHLPHPSKAIEVVGRFLKDEGYLFIAVPNDSLLGRRAFFRNAIKRFINCLPIKRKLKLKKMYPEIDEEGNKHLFYWTPRTLTRLLEKYGFRIKKHSVDYDYETHTPKIERGYRLNRFLCELLGVNLSHSILIAAQKR